MSASAYSFWRRAAPSLPLKNAAGEVTHVFTHFPLSLTVFVTRVPKTAKAPKGARWVEVTHLRDEALPNVMRKVLSAALD